MKKRLQTDRKPEAQEIFRRGIIKRQINIMDVKMNELNELFIIGNICNRIDFINNYHNDDIEIHRFLTQIIINTPKKTNISYLISLIDLAARLEIKNKALIDRYIGYLIEPNNYYLKLTILDYIINTVLLYKEEGIDYSPIKQIVLNKHDRLITKNQALLNLILLYPVEKNIYMERLKKNLKNTSDYRSHIRVYNNIFNPMIKELLPIPYIKNLLKISKSKNLGRGVSYAINRLENSL